MASIIRLLKVLGTSGHERWSKVFHISLQLQAAAMFPYIVVLEGLPMETTVPGVIVLKSTLDSISKTVATGM